MSDYVFENLPEGLYRGRVLTWGFGKSGVKETPFFGLRVILDERLEEPDEDDGTAEWVEMPATTRNWRGWFNSADNIKRTLSDLRRIGFNGTEADLDRLDADDENAFDFLDLPVVLKCSIEEYNGRDQERWQIDRRYNAPTLPPAMRSALLEAAKAELVKAKEEKARKDAEKRRDKEEAEQAYEPASADVNGAF